MQLDVRARRGVCGDVRPERDGDVLCAARDDGGPPTADAALAFTGTDAVAETRHAGTIAAIALRVPDAGYLAALGPALNAFYLERDVLLRGLGNVIYVMPPYCVSANELDRIYGTIHESLALARV